MVPNILANFNHNSREHTEETGQACQLQGQGGGQGDDVRQPEAVRPRHEQEQEEIGPHPMFCSGSG